MLAVCQCTGYNHRAPFPLCISCMWYRLSYTFQQKDLPVNKTDYGSLGDMSIMMSNIIKSKPGTLGDHACNVFQQGQLDCTAGSLIVLQWYVWTGNASCWFLSPVAFTADLLLFFSAASSQHASSSWNRPQSIPSYQVNTYFVTVQCCKRYTKNMHPQSIILTHSKNPLIFHSHLGSSFFSLIHSPSLLKKNQTNDAS